MSHGGTETVRTCFGLKGGFFALSGAIVFVVRWCVGFVGVYEIESYGWKFANLVANVWEKLKVISKMRRI